ncbi:MAG: peroxiredoxin [Gammaproteobacteria bacterium]|nr:peroxiredoxin [Gammaproteobacteria bacterium]
MRSLHSLWSGLVAICAGIALGAQAAELAPGQPAPAFALTDQHGTLQRLSDYRGQWLVVYFYPKDDTPGCTKEACKFRDNFQDITALGARVLGISVDNTESHKRFAEKYSLPFPLLSDGDGTIAKTYGALWSLGPMKFAKRHSFIIDPAGRTAKIYRDVQPERHSQEIIDDLKALQKTN